MARGTLIIISGPTASGKTSLSIEVAKAFGAEIISADSRQFYKDLDIGTAKATKQEQESVKHHFIDTLKPNEAYNAGKFEEDAIAFLDDYFKSHQYAVLVGGSGLYINAVKFGFDQLPSTPPHIREYFSKLLATQGKKALNELLKEKDPAYYSEVDLENSQRVQRALEAIEVTGQKFSSFRKNVSKKRPFQMIEVQLLPNREKLYDRINQRVDMMQEEGLLEEVKSVLQYKHENALQTVGYRELIEHLAGERTEAEAFEKIKQHTRNFAKRQYTWFKKYPGDLIYHEWNNEEVIKHLKEKLNV